VMAFATLRPTVPAVLAVLAERGIQSAFVEGGSGLAGAFVEAGAVDVVRWFIAPILVGGDQAPGALGGDGLARLADAARLHEPDVARIGDDILCAGRLIELPRTED
jgi:diaminohydroxyphosphoribosylaminopyrimidine deaminase/5-amino-6-(5-phosphoribosylamino)uracil reductase